MSVVERAKVSSRRGGRWVETEEITAGYARRLIAAARERGGLERPSRVNRTITHGQGLEILERGIATTDAAAGLHPAVAKNIERECRAPKPQKWRCAECGRVMTTAQAQRAMTSGCLAGCSGIDIEPVT